MKKPSRISVILTSYNHAKYLRESINSVLNQTFTDFELIIWDDGSTDESWDIIRSFSDPRIQSYRSQTQNVVRNIISGIELTQSQYIAIHHSDDVWESDKLEKQVNFLDTNPDVGAVFTKVNFINEDGSLLNDEKHPYYEVFEQPNQTRYEWLNRFFYSGNVLCHPSVLIRRVCYEECGMYRYGLAQLPDFDMWVRLCLKYAIHILPERLVRFRIRNNEANTSGNRPEMHIRLQFEFLQIYSNYLSITDKEEFLKVFPASLRYFDNKDYEIPFALAMMSLKSPHPSGKLFGLQQLFDLINDPEKAKKIREVYGFGQRNFIELTAKHDIFSTIAITELTGKLAVLDSQVRALDEIRTSKAWQAASILMRIPVWLAPPSSWFSQLLKRMFSVIGSPLSDWKIKRDLMLIRKSGLFDDAWYLASNPDVARAQMDPARHYLLYGGFEGRDPNKLFDSDWYLDTYPDVKTAQINPLVHYIKYGRAAGRQTHLTDKSDQTIKNGDPNFRA